MKAIRGLVLGLAPLFYVACVEADGIAEVGVGTVHPVCDPLVSECISSDEQAAEDILASLDEDETVTGEEMPVLPSALLGGRNRAGPSFIARCWLV